MTSRWNSRNKVMRGSLEESFDVCSVQSRLVVACVLFYSAMLNDLYSVEYMTLQMSIGEQINWFAHTSFSFYAHNTFLHLMSLFSKHIILLVYYVYQNPDYKNTKYPLSECADPVCSVSREESIVSVC